MSLEPIITPRSSLGYYIVIIFSCLCIEEEVTQYPVFDDLYYAGVCHLGLMKPIAAQENPRI